MPGEPTQNGSQEEQYRQLLLLKKRMLRQGVTSNARERLGRVRSANPQLAEQAESICLQLIQQGQTVNDEILKRILMKLSPKKEIKITRR